MVATEHRRVDAAVSIGLFAARALHDTEELILVPGSPGRQGAAPRSYLAGSDILNP